MVRTRASNRDDYSLEVTQGATTLVDWSQLVTYDKNVPNDQQCDAVPCVSAKITL